MVSLPELILRGYYPHIPGMTTIKIKLRPSSINGQPGSIVYAVTRHRAVRTITTDYKVYPSEWNEKRSAIKTSINSKRREACNYISRHIRWDVIKLNKIVGELASEAPAYSADEVVSIFRRQTKERSFFKFMNNVINRQRLLGKAGTEKNYRATHNSFRRFYTYKTGSEHADCDWCMINSALIEEYQAWLKAERIKPNSTSFYMRILRAVYRRAAETGLTGDSRPFDNVYTGVARTAKRAIGIDDIKRIRNLDLSSQAQLELYRDVFMFQFYCRGMAFIDAAILKKADIHGRTLTYQRQKTDQVIKIAIEPEIAGIIEKYSREDSPYIFPFISKPATDGRKQYETALRKINYSLKRIAKMAEVNANLTTYVARHTWATIAKHNGVPVTTISEALGHDSIRTTEIYLASIGMETINCSNRLILDLLK